MWAIDEVHLPNYLLPRDCPRVTYGVSTNTSAGDIATFFGGTTARRIIVLEDAWRERVASTVLHVYEMPWAQFHAVDISAGYYISRHAVTPSGARAVRGPLAEIRARNCEVRFAPDLWPLRDAVAASTLDYSIIRMRNAQRGA